MKKRKIIGSAIIGNIVEYYDFGLYAVFTPIIGRLFFPEVGDQLVQTLLAFSVFALGFFMRPLGGFVFGYIGDKLGRKIALSISIIGMAASTFMIGILPSYQEIGILATIILVLIRLCQGLCVGGEGAGVAIFVLEHLEGYRPGLIGSIVMASNMVGTLLAAFVGILLHHFCPDGHCWRYAFIAGGVIGSIGLYMRYQLNETPVFDAIKDSRKTNKHPLITAFKTHLPEMLVVLVVGGATSAVAYTIRGYLNVFFLQVLGYSQEDALYFTSIALFTMIVLLPVFGIVADKTGYRRFFFIICYTVILTIIPVYMLMANPEHNVGMVLLGLITLGALSSAICAPAYPYAIKAFEADLRFSGVAVSWNLGNALLGGTTPMISTFLTDYFKSPIAPAFYLIAVAAIFIITKHLVTTKTHKNHKSHA